MKVLGIVKSGETYLCEVGNTEIEKFLNLYYGKMKKLQVGDEVDLGAGYNFFEETKRALRSTADFIKDNKAIVDALTRGFIVLAGTEEEADHGRG